MEVESVLNRGYRATALVVLAVAAGAVILSFRPIYEPDLWWHLAQGRENAAGRLVRTNVFSFTHPDYRQRFTPWLFDTAAYLAWAAAGGAGIQALQMLLLTLTLLLLYFACRARAPAVDVTSTAAVLFVGFFILEPRAIPRPHLVSFAGMAACSLLIERAAARRSAAPLLWAVPGIALWSNFHVECVFGVVLIGILAVVELARPVTLTRREALRASIIAIACGVATMANPYGWGLIAYLYENWSVPQMLNIAELQPPPLSPYRAFFLYLIACAVLLAWQRRTLRIWEVVAAATFAALGVRYLRLTPLILLVTAPMVASRVAALAARGIDSRAVAFAALCVGLAVSRIPVRLLATELAFGTRAVAPDAFFSAEGMAFAKRAGLEGPVFNSYNLGGYLAWMLYPQVQIFQDSRLQAYPSEHFLSILVASRSQRDWDVLVADVDWAVLSVPRPNQLSGPGRFPPGEWATVFRDRAVEILVRRRGKYGRIGESK